ncbi:MAG: lytic transglycosylase domain-containing protein [Vicinamibacteria bacterium]|nr:lytic transglycosylase domain-containing protein [Vicinamibacteria bacterium]
MAHRLFLVVAAFAAASAAVPARADVYAWKDKDGRLVVSDRPSGPGVQHATYSVRGIETIRTTRLDVGPRLDRADLHAMADRHAETHAINPALVRAVIQAESAWNTRAVSPKGALGLMQLMPETATELGVVDPFDPAQNIRAGVRYLKWLLDRYDGNAELALAAYNAGPGAVDKYGKVPPYRETQAYVRKIVSVTEVQLGPKKVIYKIVELVDGREVPRYSDARPAAAYEIVTKR